MPVAAAVNALVGRVLDGLEAGVRARCDRTRVLFALNDLGCATTLGDLCEMMSADAAAVKAAIGDSAPMFFFVRFKQVVESIGGSADGLAASTSAVHSDVARASGRQAPSASVVGASKPHA